MKSTSYQINHLINLHKSLKKMYSYEKLSNLTIQQASDLITSLRVESNEKLRQNYQKYKCGEPDPSEMWRIK